ncbi:hypothetical protein [Caulobacter sp. 17J65-9]|uniref:hypothetical protein n=1 Tax=Caulobacter sp. 17J65-9 TaxID=2709382 RepID=UPI0013CBD57E|nr:hypothetical protein [Caulobacter sp. 17J65-9]NEX92637.1 hypothetical protein [Caulobacter sp. 17J65-9]
MSFKESSWLPFVAGSAALALAGGGQAAGWISSDVAAVSIAMPGMYLLMDSAFAPRMLNLALSASAARRDAAERLYYSRSTMRRYGVAALGGPVIFAAFAVGNHLGAVALVGYSSAYAVWSVMDLMRAWKATAPSSARA